MDKLIKLLYDINYLNVEKLNCRHFIKQTYVNLFLFHRVEEIVDLKDRWDENMRKKDKEIYELKNRLEFLVKCPLNCIEVVDCCPV